MSERVYPINAERQQLGKIAPIATPFVLYLEPTRFCNLKCEFCSNQFIPADKRVSMDLALFQKALSDLKQFDDKVKVLSINGVGEPLCNKDICSIVEFAKNSNRFEKIRLITNGVLLSPELNRKLVNAGLDMLWVSIEAMSSEGYLNIAGRVDFEKLVENIKDFYRNKGDCQVYIKIVDAGLKDDEEEKLFYKTFEEYSDRILVEHISNIYADVASTSKRINRFTGEELEYYDICDYMFKGLSLNADGTCSPCPVDWKEELVVGNLNSESLYDIWNGESYNKLRRTVLCGRIKDINACKNCCLYLNAESSIIDIRSLQENREEILSRL